MNNKELGTAFERLVVDSLKRQGYWVHFMTPDSRGAQPFDIIAVKNGMARAIECKTLAKSMNYFCITRLEDNQISAFELWEKCGNGTPIIYVYHRGRIVSVDYDELKAHGKVRMPNENDSTKSNNS